MVDDDLDDEGHFTAAQRKNFKTKRHITSTLLDCIFISISDSVCLIVKKSWAEASNGSILVGLIYNSKLPKPKLI